VPAVPIEEIAVKATAISMSLLPFRTILPKPNPSVAAEAKTIAEKKAEDEALAAAAEAKLIAENSKKEEDEPLAAAEAKVIELGELINYTSTIIYI
jgi:hypothetical protein